MEDEEALTSGTACSEFMASSASCNLRLIPTPSARATQANPITRDCKTDIANLQAGSNDHEEVTTERTTNLRTNGDK